MQVVVTLNAEQDIERNARWWASDLGQDLEPSMRYGVTSFLSWPFAGVPKLD